MSYKSSSMPQRSSPFRRAASPSSPPSARAAASPLSSPSKLKQSYTVSEEEEDESIIVTPTKSSTESRVQMRAQTEPPTSPSPSRRMQNTFMPQQPASFSRSSAAHFTQGDALSKLPPGLLHSLRESFSVLDSTSSGIVTPDSVHETLHSLGLSTNEIAQLFPPGGPQQISLPQYLNSLAEILVAMSPPQELLNAFSAFDDDDSGQIDVAELRRALIETPPDAGERKLTEKDIDEALKGYTGRRILGRSAIGIAGVKGINTPNFKNKGGDVFRYHEFVGNLTGASHQGQHQGQVTPA